MKTYAYLASLLIFAFVGFGLGGYYFLRAPTQPVNINAITPAGTITLEASPAPASPYLGDTLTLDINAQAGIDHITAVQLELTYDPTKLQVLKFEKTDYLPNYLASPVIAGGKVTTTLASPPDSGGRTNWGTLGKLTLKTLALGSHSLNFGPNTLVAATSTTGNSLKKADPILLTVYNLGDLTRDKKVDLFDYNLFVTHYGTSGAGLLGDLDHNNKVDLFDYNLFVANYGKISP